jgi:hypothetical protein
LFLILLTYIIQFPGVIFGTRRPRYDFKNTFRKPPETCVNKNCVYLGGDFLHPMRGRQKRKVYAEWGAELKAKGNI